MKLWRKIKKISSLFSGADTSLYAASCCYYLIISLIPFTLLLFSFISIFPFMTNWDLWLRQIIPEPFYLILKDILLYIGTHHSIGLISVSGLFTIWSASKGILAITRGLNRAMMDDTPKPYLYARIRAIFTLLPMVLLWIGIILLNMYSVETFRLFHAVLPGLARIAANIVKFRFLYSVIILFFLFSVMYRMVPSVKYPFRFCMAGGALSAMIWQSLTILFTLYIKYVSSYETLYGSFGLVLLGLIWLQFSIRVLLLSGRFLSLLSNDQFHPIRILRSGFSE